MKIGMTSNIDAAIRTVQGMGKQVRFATAVAFTRTARKIEEAEKREMRDVFDRPTPYTMTSTFVKSATPADLVAEVGLKDFAGKGTAAADFLLPQIKGGSRRQKRFEKALQAVGALPSGYRAVPGSAAKTDVFGNMDRGQIVQILSYFKAFPEMGYKANMTDKRKAALARGTKRKQGFSYFVGRPGDRLPLGVWQRFDFARGSAIKPVLIFIPDATYQAIFDFTYVATKTAEAHLEREFKLALEQALRTAR